MMMGVMGLGLVLMAGCGAEDGVESQGADTGPDYETEARESISEENMDEMLDQLDEEIAADEAVIEDDD